MLRDDLKGFAANVIEHRLGLVICQDRVRCERTLRFIRDQIVENLKITRNLHIEQRRIEKSGVDNLLLELKNGSLFERNRLFSILDWETLTKNPLTQLLEGLQRLPNGTIVILIAGKLPSNDELKKLVKLGIKIELPELKGAHLTRWVERELVSQSIPSWDPAVPEIIIELAGQNPDSIARVAEQLGLYADGGAVSVKTLAELFPHRMHATDFELSDAMLAGNMTRTEQLIHERGGAAFSLLGLISKSVLAVQRIKGLNAKGLAVAEIRSRLGTAPWLFSKQLELAKRAKLPTLSATLAGLLHIDSRLKNKSVAPEALFSKLRELLQDDRRSQR